MKKFTLFCLAAITAAAAMADTTDWMNFAVEKDGDVLESVRFKNGGKLTFGDDGIKYSDDETEKTVPYTAKHIYFSESQTPTWIETIPVDVAPGEEEAALWLTYSRDEQQISVVGMDEAAQIRVISLQGRVLRSASNAKAISTSGLEPQIVIATAISDGKTVSKKFIIK